MQNLDPKSNFSWHKNSEDIHKIQSNILVLTLVLEANPNFPNSFVLEALRCFNYSLLWPKFLFTYVEQVTHQQPEQNLYKEPPPFKKHLHIIWKAHMGHFLDEICITNTRNEYKQH